MRSKLLIVSTMLVIGMIAGCGKEEEKVAVSPVVEQAQPNAAVAPAASAVPVQVAEPAAPVNQIAVPTTPVEQMPTVVEQTAPVASGFQAAPDQGMQANIQPQAQQLPTVAPASQTVEAKSSPLVIENNAQQIPAQSTIVQAPATAVPAMQESIAAVKNELAAVGSEATASVDKTQAIGTQVKKVEAPIVIEQPKK